MVVVVNGYNSLGDTLLFSFYGARYGALGCHFWLRTSSVFSISSPENNRFLDWGVCYTSIPLVRGDSCTLCFWVISFF